MVVDTAYYDLLQVSPTATDLEIKKSYRKLAIRYHPDKNQGDEEAAEVFKRVSEAYQILSDKQLRTKYDKYGLQEVGEGKMDDPEQYFTQIFGGESFLDYIGELTLLKNLTQQFELEAEEELQAKSDEYYSLNPTAVGILTLENGEFDHLTDEEKVKKLKKLKEDKKKEELEKLEEKQRKHREEIQKELAKKLEEKLSLYTETDKSDDVVASFKEKFRLEAENLKMESFGLEILHTLGRIYISKAQIFIDSHRTFLGMGSWLGSFKEKGGIIKDTFKTIVTAVEAQKTMEKLSKMSERREQFLKEQEEGTLSESEKVQVPSTEEDQLPLSEDGKPTTSDSKPSTENNDAETTTEDTIKTGENAAKTKTKADSEAPKKDKKDEEPIPTDEDVAEMEKLLMGKILSAAWRGSHLEISSTIRDVSDKVLYDESVDLSKRLERAEALKMIGKIFKETERSKWEAEESRLFEELVAEASQKKPTK